MKITKTFLNLFVALIMVTMTSTASANECPLCETKDLAEIKKLIASGADINATNEFGVPVFVYQADWGSTEIVKALLDAGANPNAVDKKGVNALMHASGRSILWWISNKKNAIKNPQTDAFLKKILLNLKIKYSNTLKVLLAAGANVDTADNKGFTPLMYATLVNDTKAMGALLANGADTNLQNKRGYTALMLSKSEEAVSILLENGANIDATDNYGQTNLMHAAKEGKAKLTRLLLKHGADVNAENENGWTALDIAEEVGHRGIVRILRKAGAE